MGPLGADPEALRELAGSLRAASGQLTDIATGLERRTRAAGWRGPDADRFGRDWVLHHRTVLLGLGDRCARLSAALVSQAEQQVRASGAGVAAPAARGSAPTARVVQRPDDLVRSEQRFLGGVELKVGVGTAALRGDVSIQQLGSDRVRVVVSEAGGLGLAAGVGASASVGIGGRAPVYAPSTGAQAEVRARVGAVERRTWEVHEDEVVGLLARVAAAEAFALAGSGPGVTGQDGASSVVPGGRGIAGVVGGLVDHVVEHVAGFDPGTDDLLVSAVTVPAPDRVERVAELDLAAVAGAAAASRLAGSGQAGAGVVVRAGTAVTAAGPEQVVEVEGAASATLGATMLARLGVQLPEAVHEGAGLRLRLLERHDGSLDRLVVRLTTSSGGRVDEIDVDVDLDGLRGSDEVGDARSFVSLLRHGDLDGAFGSARSAWLSAVGSGAIRLSATSAEVTGGSARVGGTVGVGLQAGLVARGQVLRVDRGS